MTEGLEPIAIVGMAGRLPGADTVEEFWRNQRDGVESVTRFTEAELLAAGVDAETLRDPDYVRAAAVIEDADCFDAAFFGFSPREAEILDPQHRLFLECAWAALEDSGHDPLGFDGAIGVYAGCFMNKYLPLNLYRNPEFLRSEAALAARNFNDKDFLATRASYLLNLRGPAVTVQTACSTSLVATHLACQALWNYDCDMALVAGVALNVPLKAGYPTMEGGLLTPEARCRPFDARALGTVPGYGAGFVVLRRLSGALSDRDHIRALITGTAANNDGSLKVGFMAPSVDAQAEVIVAAQALAGVDPETIGYVEAHGTGTPIGDPIEVAALTQAFRTGTHRTGFCAIGSVKANIGHLDAAAGVAGLMRAVLALEHRTIPPHINYDTPNPVLRLDETPFYVPTTAQPWPANGALRRAAVSSFGVGGTNAHVVLDEAPAPELPGPPGAPARSWQVLPVSARSQGALAAAGSRLAAHLRAHPELDLADVAFTLQNGRRAFPVRRYVVSDSTDAAAAMLDEVGPSPVAPESSDVAFSFPGGGTQHPDMGLDIYRAERVFRTDVDTCAELVRDRLGSDLRWFLFPSAAPPDGRDTVDREHPPTVLAGIFALEYALARLWMSWGVRPAAMVGHSLGEYVAACLAGVFTLPDALEITIQRGELFQRMPSGRMLSVALSERELVDLLPDRLSLAAVNAPGLSLVSGPQAEVEALARTLEERGVDCRQVRIGVASHSWMVEPYLAGFASAVGRCRLSEPRLPFVSGVTGTWIRPQEATDAGYWARHLRSPVRFADAVRTLTATPGRLLLEVGPGNSLTTLAAAQRLVPAPVAVSSMRHPQDQQPDLAHLLGAVGRLWQHGVAVDWPAMNDEARPRRVPLPAYPFERRRYWVEPGVQTTVGHGDSAVRLPAWRRTLLPVVPERPAGTWLLLDGGFALGERLAARAEVAGLKVSRAADLDEARTGSPPDLVVAWGADDHGSLDDALVSLAVSCPGVTVTAGLSEVAGATDPWRMARAGACIETARVAGHAWRCVDVGSVDLGAVDGLADRLVAELAAGTGGMVAYRGGERWRLDYEPVSLDTEPNGQHGLNGQGVLGRGGTYLFVAGLDGGNAPLAAALAGRGAEVAAVEAEFVGDDPELAARRLAGRHPDLRGLVVGTVTPDPAAIGRFAGEVALARHLAELTGPRFCLVQPPAAEETAAHLLAGQAQATRNGSTHWLAVSWTGLDANPDRAIRVLDTLLTQRTTGHALVRLAPPRAAPAGARSPDGEAVEHTGPPPSTLRECQVAELWRDLLGVEELSITDDFFALGGHSLLAAQMLRRLRQTVPVRLRVSDLFAAPTLGQLAALLDRRYAGEPDAGSAATDLTAEAVLDPAVTGEGLPPARPGPPAAVLLTGATGFVGAFLCAELLRATDAEVYCLVRASDAAEGAERLRQKLDSIGLLTDAASRIVAVPGDLAQPLLGLGETDFAELADRVDAIYHCGAWVNFVRPYQVLKPANVLGTQEVLRLATRVRRTPVHHISTLAVLAGAFAAGVPAVTEDAELPPPVGHDTAYSESKWVAEQLVALARGRGVPVSVYRPGVVLGDRRTGTSNGEDYLTRMIQGCIQLGLAPLRDYPQPVATVDYVSRAVVALSLRPDTTGRTFHVVGEEPLAWNQIFEQVRGFGYRVPSVPYAQWRQALADQVERSPDNALAALEGMFSDQADRSMARIDRRNLEAGLSDLSGSDAPVAGQLDADYFAAVLGYFVRSGWLAAPVDGQRGGT